MSNKGIWDKQPLAENAHTWIEMYYALIFTATTYKPNLPITNYNHSHTITREETEVNETNKQSMFRILLFLKLILKCQVLKVRMIIFSFIDVIWTKNATLMLLSLYETKMHMLDNPKKKSKMWISMAEELKALNVEVIKYST